MAKKTGKKQFFEVKVPLTATKVSLLASEPDELVGKSVKLDLTKILRGKSLELKLKIVKDGNELKGVPDSILLVGSYIRRMMRRGADYVEDSFEAECRDVFSRVKPFFITRKKVSRAVRQAIRDTAKKTLIGHVKVRTAEEIINDIMSNKIQKLLATKLKKIYPLALCEIRDFDIVRKKDKISSAEVKEEKE